MATFPAFTPSYGSAGVTDFRVLRADFGDGYSQRAVDGLNNAKITWALTFEMLLDADAKTINDFLVDKGGATAFTWTAPNESSSREWVSDSPNLTPIPGGTRTTLTVNFEEVFDL